MMTFQQLLSPSGTVDEETWNRFALEIPFNFDHQDGSLIHGPPNASVGPQVRLLQAFLLALGFDIRIDGIFGAEQTEPSLKILQDSQMFRSSTAGTPSPSSIIAGPTGVVDQPTKKILQFLLRGGLRSL